MILRTLRSLLLSILPLVIGATSAPDREPPGLEQKYHEVNREILANLTNMVGEFIENGWIVGAELMVVHRGETLLHEGFGWRDRENGIVMDPGTRFNIRSMTKPLVGSIAQRLADAGKLDLDAPVARPNIRPCSQSLNTGADTDLHSSNRDRVSGTAIRGRTYSALSSRSFRGSP